VHKIPGRGGGEGCGAFLTGKKIICSGVLSFPSTAVCSGFHSTVVNCNEQLLVVWAPVKKNEAGRGGDTVGRKTFVEKNPMSPFFVSLEG
jgi:hypothetical protein